MFLCAAIAIQYYDFPYAGARRGPVLLIIAAKFQYKTLTCVALVVMFEYEGSKRAYYHNVQTYQMFFTLPSFSLYTLQSLLQHYIKYIHIQRSTVVIAIELASQLGNKLTQLAHKAMQIVACIVTKCISLTGLIIILSH